MTGGLKKLSKTPLNDYADCMSPQMALVNGNKYTDQPIPDLDFNYQKILLFILMLPNLAFGLEITFVNLMELNTLRRKLNQ